MRHPAWMNANTFFDSCGWSMLDFSWGVECVRGFLLDSSFVYLICLYSAPSFWGEKNTSANPNISISSLVKYHNRIKSALLASIVHSIPPSTTLILLLNLSLIHCPVSTRRRKSTPVLYPAPCSACTRSSVAALPVAPGEKGQPPNRRLWLKDWRIRVGMVGFGWKGRTAAVDCSNTVL